MLQTLTDKHHCIKIGNQCKSNKCLPEKQIKPAFFNLNLSNLLCLSCILAEKMQNYCKSKFFPLPHHVTYLCFPLPAVLDFGNIRQRSGSAGFGSGNFHGAVTRQESCSSCRYTNSVSQFQGIRLTCVSRSDIELG